MSNIPRRHHYVTQAYLESFLEPRQNHLVGYMRKNSASFLRTPRDLANIRNFHSFRRPDGTLDFSLETRIASEIENPGIPLIRKLASGKVNIDHQQRSTVARLIGLQDVRVPYERNFRDKNNLDNLRFYIEEMDEMSRQSNAPMNAIEVAVAPHGKPKHWYRLTRAQILAELKEAEDDPSKTSRDTFFSLADALEKIFIKMEWTVRTATGSSRFITSDRPVIRSWADGKGFGRGVKDLRSEIKFPLSSTAILEMKHRNWLPEAVHKHHRNDNSRVRKTGNSRIEVLEADDAFVESVNAMIAKKAHVLVISGREQAWLNEWMKVRLIPDKRAVTVLDTERLMSTNNERPRLIRQRERVVGHE